MCVWVAIKSNEKKREKWYGSSENRQECSVPVFFSSSCSLYRMNDVRLYEYVEKVCIFRVMRGISYSISVLNLRFDVLHSR